MWLIYFGICHFIIGSKLNPFCIFDVSMSELFMSFWSLFDLYTTKTTLLVKTKLNLEDLTGHILYIFSYFSN